MTTTADAVTITNRMTGEIRTATMAVAAGMAGIDTDDAAWAVAEYGRADAIDEQGTEWTIRPVSIHPAMEQDDGFEDWLAEQNEEATAHPSGQFGW
jgi:hypothetical protein